jgi:hypothetical protein
MKTRNKVLIGAAIVTIGIAGFALWLFDRSMDDLFDDIFGDPENWGT